MSYFDLCNLTEKEIDALIAYHIIFSDSHCRDNFGIYMDSRTCVYGDGGTYIEEYCKKFGKEKCIRVLSDMFSIREGSDVMDYGNYFPKEIHFQTRGMIEG